MIGIYKFTNKLTGEAYIGQSVDIKKRFNQHKSRYDTFGNKDKAIEDTYFHSMLRHYGFNNFDFEVIEECKTSELNDKEIFYISKFNTLYPNGYNKSKGGSCSNLVGFNSYDEIDEVFNLLKTTKLSNCEIGKLFGVSDQIISDINAGRVWHRDNISYPIRNGRALNKKYYFCRHCGKELSYYATSGLCRKCFNKDKTNYVPSKEELYDLLSNHTFVAVAKMFNVTDNAVRRWCDKYNIPRDSKYYKKLAI